jgi:hypothetical protein
MLSTWSSYFPFGKASNSCLKARSQAAQVIVFGETHLRRIVSMYASYYNGTRTHLSLGKDAPISRTIVRFGPIIEPMVGGLHHRYARI